jgi:ribosomal protein L34E
VRIFIHSDPISGILDSVNPCKNGASIEAADVSSSIVVQYEIEQDKGVEDARWSSRLFVHKEAWTRAEMRRYWCETEGRELKQLMSLSGPFLQLRPSRPKQLKNLTHRHKKVSRTYGGVLSAAAVKERFGHN